MGVSGYNAMCERCGLGACVEWNVNGKADLVPRPSSLSTVFGGGTLAGKKILLTNWH